MMLAYFLQRTQNFHGSCARSVGLLFWDLSLQEQNTTFVRMNEEQYFARYQPWSLVEDSESIQIHLKYIIYAVLQHLRCFRRLFRLLGVEFACRICSYCSHSSEFTSSNLLLRVVSPPSPKKYQSGSRDQDGPAAISDRGGLRIYWNLCAPWRQRTSPVYHDNDNTNERRYFYRLCLGRLCLGDHCYKHGGISKHNNKGCCCY